MRFEQSIEIAAPSDRVFEVYADVERWPEWTASVTSVEWVEGTAVEPGARARVRQPKLPVAEWTVTEVEPGRSFTWVATAPGVRTTGFHLVEPVGARSRVTARVDQEGVGGRLVGLVYGRLTRRYLDLETAGLKARCEG